MNGGMRRKKRKPTAHSRCIWVTQTLSNYFKVCKAATERLQMGVTICELALMAELEVEIEERGLSECKK